jgi:hypothetical protein
MKFENHRLISFENLDLPEKCREKFSTGNDLQIKDDPEATKASKDLIFYLRKPFCCGK